MAELEVARVVEDDTQLSRYMAMAMMLYSLPRPTDRLDAIAVLPGLGEDWRLIDAVNAWQAHPSLRHLLVAGTNGAERTQVQPDIAYLQQPPVNLRRLENVHTQVSAQHTKEQAEWLVGQVAEHEITSLGLYVSPYHLLRAYCTVLKAFQRAKVPIALIPLPVAKPPQTPIPETSATGWQMVDGEVKRIQVYQEKGDVVSYDELQEYINWLWNQPVLAM